MRISSLLQVTTAFAGLIGVLAVAYIDFVTGFEVRVFPLYLLPIGFVAWHLGSTAGVAASTLAALALTLTDRLAGKIYAQPLVEYWNTCAEFIGFTVVALLIARQTQQLKREHSNARADALTGVANRRAFHEIASQELSRARRYNHVVTLAYLDLDDFKSLNDTLGHAVGDDVLIAFSAALRDSTRDVDTISRLGGDEFAILFPETDGSTARLLLTRLQEAVRESFRLRNWDITLSCGAVTFTKPPNTLRELLTCADAVMFEVKRSGKNSLRVTTIETDNELPHTVVQRR